MLEITSRFTQHLKETLAKSLSIVVSSNCKTVFPIHLLLALAQQEDSIASKILQQNGVKKENLEQFIKNEYSGQELPTPIPNLSEETKIILENAVITAATHEHRFISTEHLLFGILETQTDDVRKFFQKESVNISQLQNTIKQTLSLTLQIPISIPQEQEEYFAQQNDEIETQRALDYFTKNITNLEYRKTQTPVIGRSNEIERLCVILGRKTKNNPVLVGDPGVGKSAIVEGLAQLIAQNKIPSLKNHNIYSLNISSLIAGTMYRGSFETRLQQLINELKDEKNSILFIDELHTIVGAGSNSGTMDVANILKPALAKGEIKCIGATTYEEYKKWIESDGALERRFQKIQVEEPSVDETRAILQGIKKSFATHHNVNYTDQIIDLMLELSNKYFPDKRFPDKAIDLMDEVGSYARKHKPDVKKITQELVIDAICSITSMKHEAIKKQTKQSLNEIEKTLGQKIIGQEDSIAKVSHALKRARVGIRDEQKPVASFLFIGPSGVGKTELAKQIAKEYFQGPRNILRLDMSEYKEAFNASKLLGSPAGYIGYKDSNVLADHIHNYPRSVILFDEIEKAHPDVLNLLLQILEEGTLRDASGRELSFKHAIIILTSNAGHKLFSAGGIGFEKNNAISESEIRSTLEDILRPELLNRIDLICPFKTLSDEALAQITIQKLECLAQKVQKHGLKMSFDDGVVDKLVNKSQKTHGARALEQQIIQYIEPLIVDELLAKNTKKQIKIKFSQKSGLYLTR